LASALLVTGTIVPNIVLAQVPTFIRSILGNSTTPATANEASAAGIDSISVAQDKFGNIYVADGSSQTIKKYDGSGRFLQTIGSPGTSSNGTFSGAMSLTTDVFGNVIVANSGNKLVQVFDGAGTLLTSFSFAANQSTPSQAGTNETGIPTAQSSVRTS
jgi:hypothetical protein